MYAVDANIFIHGRKPRFSEMVTVPEVVEELKSESGERGFNATQIAVKEPTNRSLEIVKELSEQINSPTSEADEKLLALARDQGAVLVSDDKALQNMALHLDIEFEGFMEDKIEEKRSWKLVCPSCGRETSKRCSSCGKEPISRIQA